MSSLRLLPLAAAAAALALPASAGAATTLGTHSAPGSHNGGSNVIDSTWFQVSTPSGTPSYTAPANGVITGWAMQEGIGPFFGTADRAALRVFRANGDGTYTVVGAAPRRRCGPRSRRSPSGCRSSRTTCSGCASAP